MDGKIIQALGKKFQILQTHLSWVILTGKVAYKIKKPLNLGFNDFTTLEKRKFYCEREVLYNAALAKNIYIGVIPITGTLEEPVLEGAGTPIEYAVKMHEFPQASLFSSLIKQNKITGDHIKDLSLQVANFHQHAPALDKLSTKGDPDFSLMQANFTSVKSLKIGQHLLEDIATIEKWAKEIFQKLFPVLKERKNAGFIRACHGDLHLNNIVMQEEKGIIFDCIEFNEDLRWIDVINEIAFLAMDLDFHQRSDLATLFINYYFEQTGDYLGARCLNFFQCYRAMVRAKITAIEFEQSPTQLLVDLFTKYVTLAKHYTDPKEPKLYVTVGVSGSGKTIYTENLLKQIPAIRLRTDVIRKQISSHLANQYTAESIKTNYLYLKDIAKALLEFKLNVIIDATCLKHWQRQIFVDLAYRLHVHLQLLLFEAPCDILEHRITERLKRHEDASDATKEVLALQLASLEPLTESEREIGCLIPYQAINDLIRSKEN
jgi:uncharacterized protein